MKPSSISSSETPRRRLIEFRPRVLSAGFAAILLMLGAVELALRIPVVADALPVRTHFNRPDVVVRLQTLERLKRQVGRIDVLFVGSSVVRCNIRPDIFDQLLMRHGYSELVSFNAGMSGLWPSGVRLYTEHLWLPETEPRVVIQGIRLGELVLPSQSRPYDEIVSSPIESEWHTASLTGRVQAAAFERIHLLQYRGIWPQWLQRYERGRPAPLQNDEVHVFTDARGWTPHLPTLDVVRARNLLASEQPYTALTSDGNRQDALDSIRLTARAARRRGATYVLVNVPEHVFRWPGADGRARYARYLQALREFAEKEGFPFVDVTRGDPERFSNDAEYSDYHHMSPEGAARFTTMLESTLEGSLAGLPAGLPRPIARVSGVEHDPRSH
jgi:hypothetical protein